MSGTASFPGWYVEFQANVLRQLSRPGELEQTTAEEWNGNQAALKKALTEVLLSETEKPVKDNRFCRLNTFTFTVPADYDHGTQLAKFAEENRDKFYFYNDAITDPNFAKVTNRLVPGKTYEVKIFKITRRVSSEDCLTFMKAEKAILVGAQGISIAWQQAKEKFPKGKWLVSFDGQDALWEDTDGYHRVPCVGRSSDGVWRFRLGYFGYGWRGGGCLFCLRDV